MNELFTSFQRPSGTTDYKFRVTLGFYDPQTKHFQTKIPSDIFAVLLERAQTIRGLKFQPVGVAVEPFRGFSKYVRVSTCAFDIQVDYVQAERQAVFVHNDTVQAICHPDFLAPMCVALESLLTHISDDGVLNYVPFV
jgi:hypothetical protein